MDVLRDILVLLILLLISLLSGAPCLLTQGGAPGPGFAGSASIPF